MTSEGDRAKAAPVVIIGAGPVGLTLALDLAARLVPVIVIEQREPQERATPRANHVSARAMETFRRLGLADEVRSAGLPESHPADVVWVTDMVGFELARIVLSDRDGVAAEDAQWPTPEPQHKINQMFLEPILRRAAQNHPLISMRMPSRLDSFVQDSTGITCWVHDLSTGREEELRADYLVGCDGAHSTVRRRIGAQFEGDAALTKVVSFHARVPELTARLPRPLAHRYFVVDAEQHGVAVSLDGGSLWSFHAMLPSVDADPATLDPDAAIRSMTGIEGLAYELLSTDAWTGRRLLADRMRDGRVLLCGDAAHVWVPNAGYGMNAGIADAENAAWRLAAMVQGWGGPGLLEGYERERYPVTEQVSRAAKSLALVGQESPPFAPGLLTQSGEAAARARAKVGAALLETNRPQFLPLGLNFGYFYDDSPNILHDVRRPPAFAIGEYTPSTVPGCRAPYAEPEGVPLYDLFGEGFTLVRTVPDADASVIVRGAVERGIPLVVLDVPAEDLAGLYTCPLTMIRPDRHVAWCGQAATGFEWLPLAGWPDSS